MKKIKELTSMRFIDLRMFRLRLESRQSSAFKVAIKKYSVERGLNRFLTPSFMRNI